jgi:hypothetical protein
MLSQDQPWSSESLAYLFQSSSEPLVYTMRSTVVSLDVKRAIRSDALIELLPPRSLPRA